jgi:peptidoglycan hydrolase CwlO-like protein
MKKTALKASALIIVLGLVVIMIIGSTLFSPTLEVANEKQIVEVEKEVVVKEDPIDVAKRELERINNELDQVEQAGIARREEVVASYEAKLAELKASHEADLRVIDAELERVRETRTGF